MIAALDWLHTLARLWEGGHADTCAHHDRHDTAPAPLAPFPFTVFDAFTYRDTDGYCTGDDDVSRTLLTLGRWEPDATELVAPHLARPGVVLDLGAHVGWYTIHAARAGRPTLALTSDPEHLGVLDTNAAANDAAGLVVTCRAWIDADTARAPLPPPGVTVALAKIDLEGNDAHAVRAIRPLIDAGLVGAILCEVSPVFGPGYPELVQPLLDAGYTGTLIPERTAVTSGAEIAAYHQRDVLFEARP